MNKSYLKGLIGALIGGIIGSIPWVALSVFNNTMYAILTVLIGLGAVKGYQILNGKISKLTPWLIGAVCLIVMTLSSFVFIPCVAFMKEGYPVTIANLKLVYDNLMSDLVLDYVVGIVFTFLGVSGIINQMSQQIKANGGNPDDVKFEFFYNKVSKDDDNKIKDYFLDKKAVSSTSAIELDGTEDLSDATIDLLLRNKTLVLTSDNKYYYDTQREEKLKKSNKRAMIIAIVAMVVIFGLLIVFSGNISNNTSKNTNKTNNTTYNTTTTSSLKKLKFEAPSGYKEYEEDDVLYYYPKKDLSGESGLISLSLVDDIEYYDEFTKDLENLFVDDLNTKKLEIKEFKNKNNLQVVMGSFEITVDDDKAIDTVYYIFLDNKMAIVEAFYYKDNVGTFEKDAKAIVESFKK